MERLVNEHEVRHIALDVYRKGLIRYAREVRIVEVDNPPCGHYECRERLAFSPILARGLNPDKVARRAAMLVIRERLQQAKDARDRAASEALGG